MRPGLSPAQRIERDLAALEGLALPGAAAFFRALAREDEPYELGLAHTEPGDSWLVSYNPRRRDSDFRQRALRALGAQGLPVEVVEELFSRLKPEQCSTVVGLELSPGQRSATVYVEELDRFGLDHDFINDLSGLIPTTGGQPYILAVDLPSLRWKAYGLHERAPGLLPELEGPGAAAWIEQRCSHGGLKLYRCFDYFGGHPGPAPSIELPWPRPRVTSIGGRLHPRPATTTYWCVSGPDE